MTTTLDQNTLQLVMEGETDICIRRDFTHPPSRVWRAVTEPALIRQWLTSQDPMIRCEMDLRAGGSFRYEWEAFFFTGAILAADAPHHLKHVETFSADPDYHVEVTTDLAAHDSGTRMTIVMRYADATARAAAVAAGFADGMGDVYDRLAALLATD